MFLMRCEMGWVVLTILSLSLPVDCAVNVTQPYRVVSTNGTTQIQCFIHPPLPRHRIRPSSIQHLEYPYPYPEDLQVTLLKGLHGSQKLCSSTLDPTEQREKSQNEGEVQCEAQAVDGAVKVTVFGLRATDTDIYRCEIQVFYPPPYLQLTGNGTLIHVVDSSDCPAREAQRQRSGEEEEDEPMIAPVSVPVIVLIILIVCVLVIIIYFQTLQCERGRKEVVRMPPSVLLQKTEALPFPSKHMV
ncbi:cytotoxic T-lymphocyte protein 4 [Kryptolebias marmoratus]|uniref:cytotoxic T-lymphocyte protein 4 n=1 Tax=Kryptolebias marmoratus TaxID=37003 RepID=UPI0007F8FAE6|nr:cytotoxic T-lymphocyte protein 4 [Kryptolebias marmoratus]